jgi:GNAT superfamily N-acetyltransferase
MTPSSSRVGPQGTASVAPVRVLPIRDGKSLNAFIRLPRRIYDDDPAWVPPLESDVRRLLRPSHPFHDHADVEWFLAVRGGETVGRVAAAVNHQYNSFHETRTGFIGLFESENDETVAAALLETATDWLRGQGMTRAIGPFNLSTNDELYSPGILLDNYGRPPVLLMAHNPPYYPELFEAAGWEKERDLLSYLMEDQGTPERLVRGVRRLTGAVDGLVVRQLDLRRLDEEVERVKEVYNSAWQRNWGFAPLTDREIARLARDLKRIVDPRFALLAEVHGEPVGFALALPDLNQALRYVDGRLFPFGFLKVLWHRRRIDCLRVFTLGLKPQYQRRGIDALFYLQIYQNGLAAGYRYAEAGWILEDNWDMRRALERLGGRVDKTYRVYGQALA